MKLVNSIDVATSDKPAVLQLLHGDLSAIPPAYRVDILVISAFPNDYNPLPGSLMLALKEKGLSLQDFATHKSADYRATLGCWLSEPLPASLQDKLHFKRILCFEPGTHSDDPLKVVGNIFRCLNNFVFNEEVTRIAMPVIASGYQKVPFEKMLPALIATSVFWLQQGLPLDCINIVVYAEDKVLMARDLFERAKEPLPAPQVAMPPPARSAPVPPPPVLSSRGLLRGLFGELIDLFSVRRKSRAPQVEPPATTGETMVDEKLDYFVSYAHTQTKEVQHFVNVLSGRKPGLRIFYDRSSIPAGGLWIKQISDAIGKADKVLVFMSPDYTASMVCWDEFQCAKLKEYNSKMPVIQTIYLTTDPGLPPIMGIHSYIDCREGDLVKLARACEQLLPVK